MSNDTRNDRAHAFPFHYGGEAESYTFYRVPKVLFTAPVFENLSTDAKLLYGLLLDRMQLSSRNGWVDDSGRVYIYYTVESIMDALTCGNKKAGRLLAELDDKRGIGLITRERQGLGRPDRIFVHKCVVPEMATEMSDKHVKTCQNDTSGDVQKTLQDMSKPHANNTDISDIEKSHTNHILSIRNDRERTEKTISSSADTGMDIDVMEERIYYEQYFEDNCQFSWLKKQKPIHKDVISEIRELILEVCCSTRKTIRIAGEEKPLQIVKSRFMKLNVEHIQYVLSCFLENTTQIRNIKQYLLTSLYNAPMTIDSYYTALARHDMYGYGSNN